VRVTSGLNQPTIAGLVLAVLVCIISVLLVTQWLAEREAFLRPSSAIANADGVKRQYEIAKLAAEVRQIRSDTSGSLFWLKTFALFVTVGGGVGGYLLGQSRSTQARLKFEESQRVDAAYQAVIQELASEAPLRRAAAAARLGSLLETFPVEWEVGAGRKAQLVQLTKQILAAALAIEENETVRKSLTIAIVMHRPIDAEGRTLPGDLSRLDLSGAHAQDAYWAKTDLSYADLYRADLTAASLRQAVMRGAQLRETLLVDAVLIKADCQDAFFKRANLRGADLSGAILTSAHFDAVEVDRKTRHDGADWTDPPRGKVTVQEDSGTSTTLDVIEWLRPR
jgi:hypothetical protein